MALVHSELILWPGDMATTPHSKSHSWPNKACCNLGGHYYEICLSFLGPTNPTEMVLVHCVIILLLHAGFLWYIDLVCWNMAFTTPSRPHLCQNKACCNLRWCSHISFLCLGTTAHLLYGPGTLCGRPLASGRVLWHSMCPFYKSEGLDVILEWWVEIEARPLTWAHTWCTHVRHTYGEDMATISWHCFITNMDPFTQ